MLDMLNELQSTGVMSWLMVNNLVTLSDLWNPDYFFHIKRLNKALYYAAKKVEQDVYRDCRMSPPWTKHLIAKMTEKIYKTTQGTAFTRLETVSMNL
jgi:hypothetical protein